MHSRIPPSLFFINKIGAPQGDTLGWMKFFSSNSSNWSFDSLKSIRDIRHEEIWDKSQN